MAEISIVIPTYNSARTLGSCLRSVSNQRRSPKEVLVIDRFSKDGSQKIAQSYGAEVIEIDANRSVARNLGLEHSSTDGVVFIDSDMILPPTLVDDCETGLKSHDALIIPESSSGVGFWARCKALERRTHQGNDLLEAARCFRKEAFIGIGGYDSTLEAGEDWDIQHRANLSDLSIGRTRSVIVHDEGNATLPGLLKKKYNYGKTGKRYLKLNPYVGFRQIHPYRRVVIPGLRIMQSHPLEGFGVVLLKTMEFAVAGVGLAKASLERGNRRSSVD